MSSPRNSLALLRDRLSHLSTPEEKANAALSLMRRLAGDKPAAKGTHHSQGGNGILSAPQCPFPEDEYEALMLEHGVTPEIFENTVLQSFAGTSHALELNPCAYVDTLGDKECYKNGTATCSGCRLVRYCSRVSFYLPCLGYRVD